MDALTINEAAETTGWSPRMLRYIERIGLIEPPRSAAGYRIFGPAELQRLRTLRELLAEHEIGLGDVGVRAADAQRRRSRAVRRRLARGRAAPSRPASPPATGCAGSSSSTRSSSQPLPTPPQEKTAA